jgi:hypothetical protein
MRSGFTEILQNAEFEVEYVFDFVRELSTTEETRKLWRAWAGVLEHYVKAVSAMRRATDQGSSKAWSDDIIYQQKNDPILQYAFQARDHATHVFEAKRDASPRTVSIGNGISISLPGEWVAKLGNNLHVKSDGSTHLLPEGTLKANDGRYVGGTIPKSAIQEREHYLILAEITTRSGTYSIPNPEIDPEKRALHVAEHLAKWLKSRLLEANEFAANERRQ